MEDIEDSDGWNAQNMSTDWVCSTECGLSVYSHLLVLTYAIYAKSGYNMYRGWTQTDYQNEHYNINQKDKGTLDDRGRDGGANFILSIKEQETRLTFQADDDDDDDMYKCRRPFFTSIQNNFTFVI